MELEFHKDKVTSTLWQGVVGEFVRQSNLADVVATKDSPLLCSWGITDEYIELSWVTSNFEYNVAIDLDDIDTITVTNSTWRFVSKDIDETLHLYALSDIKNHLYK